MTKLWQFTQFLFENVKKTLSSHAVAMAMFVIIAYVLLYVPQIANVVVQLPYDFTRNQDPGVLGFWVFVPLVGMFYYLFWLKLVRESRPDDRRIITMSCVIGGVLLLFASPTRAYFHEVCSRWIESEPLLDWLYNGAVVFGMTWYVSAWWLLLANVEAPSDALPTTPPMSLEHLHRVYFRDLLFNRGWAKPRFLLALPLALANAFLLGVHFLLCGLWAKMIKGAMGRYPRTRRIMLPGSYAAFGGTMFAITYYVGQSTSVVSGNHCFSVLIPPLVCLLLWTLLLMVRDYWGCEKSLLVGATWRTLILWLTASLFGEFLWCLPSLPYWSDFCSYRLYTIWVTFHLCFGLVALGALADLWHLTLKAWPIRQITIGLVVVAIVFGLRSVSLAPQGQEFGDERWKDLQSKDDALQREKKEEFNLHNEQSWYQQLWNRLEYIQETTDDAGPVVLVAASGGGSRAALFATLVLEGLEKQEFPALDRVHWTDNVKEELQPRPQKKTPPAERKARWSDRILLVSGVSGGSLATAHFNYGQLRTDGKLRNTFEREMNSRFRHEYEKKILSFYKVDVEASKNPDAPIRVLKMKGDWPERRFDDLKADEKTGLKWMLVSSRADDMCTDFMAPLLRSVLTLRTERGTGVSQFWQDRLEWPKEDLVHNLSHDRQRPLIIFNATDARHGNRFLLGFPALPRRIATFHLERKQYLPLEFTGVVEGGASVRYDKYFMKDGQRVEPFYSEKNTYKIYFEEGFTYTVDLKRGREDAKGAPKHQFDPYLIIEDSTGKPIDADDDSGGDLNARITDFKPVGGTYRIIAATFADTPGEYVLTIRKNQAATQLSSQVENSAYDPNLAYTQSLADFSPGCRLGLAQAVRASANFPWGFHSCYLRRNAWDKNSSAEEIRAYFTKDGDDLDIFQIVELLPVELNLLDLDGIPSRAAKLPDENEGWARLKQKLNEKVKKADDDTMYRCMEHLEGLTKDPHAPSALRDRAAKIVNDLECAYVKATDRVTLLDGGVNDNTGIPAIMESLQHLKSVASIADPLVNRKNKELAGKILKRLRERGVIIIEIDSGAQPSSDPTHDLKTPLQGLENAGFTHAVQDRERYLRRIKKILGPEKTSGELADIPWVIHHRFICNYATKDDALTAWALGPRDKAHVMATFFCEYQKWRTDQNSTVIEEWCNFRNEALSRSYPRPAPNDPDFRILQWTARLKAIRDEFRDNEHRRIAQLARIQVQQKRIQK